MESEDAEAPLLWRILGQWPAIVLLSVLLMVLTFNPLLAGFLPYVRAGWPALRTAFWLKKADPWKARGMAGFLFHLCMALFRAGVCAFCFVVGTGFFATLYKEKPDLRSFAIAISTILVGCLLSSILGWIAIAFTLRHRCRMYVMSNLYTICRGDFAAARTAGLGRVPSNPVNYIMGVATVVPLLALWFVAIRIVAPGNQPNENLVLALTLIGSLPIGAIACVVFVIYLSPYVAAESPAECWGAEVPETEEVPENWYQRTD